jgi:site-specific DNA-cytosine methylase
MLNTGGNKNESMARGADAHQNRWLYISAEIALSKLKPKVFFGENAPGLFNEGAKDVVENLYNIAKKYNYSLSVIKTDTRLHGVPQRRVRTFYFFWKSEFAPIINWYERSKKSLDEYLKEIPAEASLQNVYPYKSMDLINDFSYKFMKNKFGNNWRKELLERGFSSIFKFLEKEKLYEEALQYAIDTKNERGQKYFSYNLEKLSQGKGYWDSSPHVYTEHVNAVISKNMCCTVHPTEERYMNIRENMHLMGLPHDFQVDEKKVSCITQNVPVNTASDMVREAKKFINNELRLSNVDILKQDNINQTVILSKHEILKNKIAVNELF